MPSRDVPQPVSVTGGMSELDIEFQAVDATAQRLAEVAERCAGSAREVRSYLLDAQFGGCAVVDPSGYAAFEQDLLDAIGAAGGLGTAAAQAHDLHDHLRAAVASYQHLEGWLRSSFGGEPGWLTGLAMLPLGLTAGAATMAVTGDPVAAGQAVLGADPAFGDTVFSAALTGIGLLNDLESDGHGVVRRPGIDTAGVAGRAPRSLSDIVGDLAQRDDGRHGAIDVRVLTMADGTRRAIVDITGTKSFDPLPTHDVTSLTTNSRAVVGRPSAYEQGVLAAMHRAGVRVGDDVLMVGHSQGGMVAVNAAREALRSGQFNVTHVVTAGAPIGRTVGALPKQVQVLALENKHDLVPHLDGNANPNTVNVTTVTGDRGDGTVVGDHDLRRSYLPITADTDASRNTAVRAYIRSADGYLHATSVETHTYQIQRR